MANTIDNQRTRQMLVVTPRTAPGGRVSSRAFSLNAELVLIVALVVVGLVAQSLNMFHYPAFTLLDDEGIYMGQAWAVVREHSLTPYTYFYDHAPAGWILLGLWSFITGGFHTFGNPVDGGRVMMLLLHLAMVPLLYRVARKLGCEPWSAAIAGLLFSISPLAIFYQRMVLLDSIMLFWALLSLDLLLDGRGRLSRVVLSGVCFALAILSKETALFLLPAMLLIAFQQRWKHQGPFAVSGWVLPVVLVSSWYPLYALLKGELWPSEGFNTFFGSGDTIRGGTGTSVSLIQSIIWQSTRDGGGTFNLNNQFWTLIRTDWLPRDALLVAGGTLAVLVNLVRGIRDRRALVIGLLGILPLLYLARGGLVLNYYILFAIPFLCLNIAFAVAPLLKRLPVTASGALTVVAAVLLVGAYWQFGSLQPLYTESPDLAGREAVTWIKQHIPADSRIIMRDNLWTDMHEPGEGGPAFPNAHSHYKVASDPAIRDGVFHNDWHNVDYLIMSPGLQDEFKASGNTLALNALQNAHLVKRWESAPGTKSLQEQQIIELWKVDKPGATTTAMLNAGTAYLSSKFEKEGAYQDATGAVTSEAQSYALLRSVWTEDRDGFYRIWNWTKGHMLDKQGLLSWVWKGGSVTDTHTATDADTDTALALLMASERWNDPALLEDGKKMVSAIWQHEVVTLGGTPYITAGDWAAPAQVVALNPSYFSPYAYRVFLDVDPNHDWKGVITSGYQVLFDASAAPLSGARSAGLPPDWVGLDRNTGKLVPLQLDKTDTTRYSYDAARTYWRVALDLRWSGDGRAETYLKQAGFLRDEVTRKSTVSAVYAHDGAIIQAPPSTVSTAGAVAALLTLDQGAANTLFASQFVGGMERVDEGAYWGDPNDLYSQEWAWFATAFYADALPQFWTGH